MRKEYASNENYAWAEELWCTGKEKKENGRNSGKEIMRILKRGTDLSKGTKLRVQDKFIIKYHFMLKKILYKLSKIEQQF